MKKFFYLALTAAAMLATACNKEMTGPETPGTDQMTGGDAYVKIGINLPTTFSTKANDVFDDGEDYEYAVEDAVLVIFAGGTDETATTLRSAYDLKKSTWGTESNPQITTSSTITQKILTNNIAETEDAYALVILNTHDFFKVENETLKQGTTDLTNMTFADFSQLLLDESDKNFSNQAFTMTNMPHIHTTGGSAAPTVNRPNVLMKIEKANIYPTEAEANGGAAAAEIDVERVVAKVSVKYNFLPAYQDGFGNTTLADGVTILNNLGWFIDNTNPKAFVVRNTAEPVSAPYDYLAYKAAGAAGATAYRMASGAAIHTEPISGNSVVRTYWGIDPNYNVDATGLKSEADKVVDNTLMVFNPDGTLASGRLRAGNTHYYCAENTFDVAHQTVKNTTRVVLAAQFNGGTPFFTLSSEPNTIRSATQMADFVKGEVLARVNMLNWLDEYFPGTLSPAQISSLLDVVAVPATYNADKSVNVKSHMTITLNTTNVEALANDATAATNAKTAWNSTLKTSQEEYIANNVDNQLSYYREGVAYYQVLIRHFNDAETPWTPTADMTNEIPSIYGADAALAAQNYLGRYGVLRNNWYDITVEGIRQIGSSTVPSLTDVPDDNVDKYIKVKINIMPWAKRVQSVIL